MYCKLKGNKAFRRAVLSKKYFTPIVSSVLSLNV